MPPLLGAETIPTHRAPRENDGFGELVVGTRRRGRAGIYAVSCVVVAILVLGFWALDTSLGLGRPLYTISLWCVCLLPAFLFREPQQRLLVVFFLWYFVMFGMHTLVAIFFGATEHTLNFLKAYAQVSPALSESDLVVILGAGFALAGYLAIQAMSRREARVFSNEWSHPATFAVAISCWIPGMVFSVAYYLTVTPAHIPTHLLYVPLNIASNLRLLTMMASVMLIYLLIKKYRPFLIWSVLLSIMSIEYVLGFIGNTKEVSYRVIVLLLVGRYLLSGSFNMKIVAFIIVSFVPYHLMFNVYRNEVLLARGATSVEAVEDLARTRSLLEKHASREQNIIRDNLQALADRVNGKVYVDIIVGRTGKDVPFQDGATLANMIYTFIPRALWPEKPDTSTGQLFNHQFGLSASKLTFVPTTFIGELYWNSGWIGVSLGMFLVGASLGYIGNLLGARSDSATLPRFMLVLMACYFLILRFEASIGQQYGIFGRILLILAGLHGLLILTRLAGKARNYNVVADHRVSQQVKSASSRRWRFPES